MTPRRIAAAALLGGAAVAHADQRLCPEGQTLFVKPGEGNRWYCAAEAPSESIPANGAIFFKGSACPAGFELATGLGAAFRLPTGFVLCVRT